MSSNNFSVATFAVLLSIYGMLLVISPGVASTLSLVGAGLGVAYGYGYLHYLEWKRTRR